MNAGDFTNPPKWGLVHQQFEDLFSDFRLLLITGSRANGKGFHTGFATIPSRTRFGLPEGLVSLGGSDGNRMVGAFRTRTGLDTPIQYGLHAFQFFTYPLVAFDGDELTTSLALDYRGVFGTAYELVAVYTPLVLTRHFSRYPVIFTFRVLAEVDLDSVVFRGNTGKLNGWIFLLSVWGVVQDYSNEPRLKKLYLYPISHQHLS